MTIRTSSAHGFIRTENLETGWATEVYPDGDRSKVVFGIMAAGNFLVWRTEPPGTYDTQDAAMAVHAWTHRTGDE